MKIDRQQLTFGKYRELFPWLRDNFGEEGEGWWWQFSSLTEDPEIKFKNPQDEILCTLRWG